MFNGLKVVTADYLFETNTSIPKRRHKKKRIQKKYIKKYGYAKKVKYEFIMHDGVLYCHSKMLRKFENHYESVV